MLPINAPVLRPLHGIASRHDLPLPFSLVLIGAIIVLAVSFLLMLLARRQARLADPAGVELPWLTRLVDHRAVRLLLRLIVLVVYGWAALALFAGQDLLTNPIFGFVFAWMWVGLVPLSLLLGSFWRATNPLRTIHAGLAALARTDPEAGLLTLPRQTGVWPAAAGLLGFAFLELVQPDRTTLPVLQFWALCWLVIMILGAVLFGRRWIGAADPFEVYAMTVAGFSPWRRVGGQIRLVNPLRGLTALDPPPGAAAVVCVLLGSTAFDSFTNTSWWIQSMQDSTVSPVLWGTGGLLAMIMIVGGTFVLAALSMAPLRADGSLRGVELPRLLASAVVPIVIGYAMAHYLSFLVVEGQRTAIGLSDPLGRGWDVLGSASMGVNSALYDHPSLMAMIALVAIVGGHILGIIAAHEKSLALLGPDAALRGQLPMLLVMIFYTYFGLLLLFSP